MDAARGGVGTTIPPSWAWPAAAAAASDLDKAAFPSGTPAASQFVRRTGVKPAQQTVMQHAWWRCVKAGQRFAAGAQSAGRGLTASHEAGEWSAGAAM